MLKDIIKRCAYLLNRKDIENELDDAEVLDDITNSEIKQDVKKLIDIFNIVTSSVLENYLELIFCEKILSNANSEISFERFSRTPIKVIKVETESGKSVSFANHVFFVKVPLPRKLYDVTYRFVPDRVYELTDNVCAMPQRYQDIICYGVLGEFLATISKYDESIFWKEKFTSEIFNIKTKRERRVKSTYCL